MGATSRDCSPVDSGRLAQLITNSSVCLARVGTCLWCERGPLHQDRAVPAILVLPAGGVGEGGGLGFGKGSALSVYTGRQAMVGHTSSLGPRTPF